MTNWKTTEHYTIRHSEIGQHGRVTLPALVTLMQEAAWNSAASLGCSVYDLMENGLTWILYRLQLEVLEYPRHLQKVAVETWPSGLDRLYTYREYRMYDEAGKLMAQATSAWLVLDLKRRKVIPIPEFIKEKRFPQDFERMPWDGHKIPDLKNPTYQFPVQVRWHEEDWNHHVNNAYYLQWIMESMPVSLLREQLPKKVIIIYKNEAHYGEGLEVLTEESAANEFLHQIVNEEGKELVRAESVF